MTKYVKIFKIKVNSFSKESFKINFTLVKIGQLYWRKNVYLHRNPRLNYNKKQIYQVPTH